MAGHHDHPHDEHDAHDTPGAPDAHGHGAHGHGAHGHGAHGHGHGGHGHSHGVAADADRRWLTSALTLIVLFMAVEVVVGFAASSLALISDAAHMLTDAASIVLALIAMRLAAKPARGGFTYGLKRAEILSAQANGVTLLVLSAWLGYESIGRLINPPEVSGGLVLVTALVGIVVNLAAAWCMSKANRSSLNVEGAFQHVVTDLYAFIATAVAGAIMLTTGFGRADAIASLIVVVLMLRAGIGLVRDSGRIFLEAAPAGIDPNTLADRLVETPWSRRSTTCTSGRSPPTSPRSPRTSWSPPAATATPSAATCSGDCVRSTGSPTPPCRSTMSARTRTSSCCRSPTPLRRWRSNTAPTRTARCTAPARTPTETAAGGMTLGPVVFGRP